MGISSPGIGSNLDVNSIVSQLMGLEQRPLTALAKKEAGMQAKVAGYGSLTSALGAFQTALTNLSSRDKFQAVTATAADKDILSGSATNQAVSGAYDVKVTQLAQAQTITTGGRASATASIGDGAKTTLTFSFGTITGGKLVDGKYVNDAGATPPAPTFTQDPDKTAASVVIDSSNNSLQGIRDAINKANIGVTATIVSDGSATPYHLVLTSNSTGAASSMKISVARDASAPVGDTGLQDLLGYDPAATQNLKQTSVAQDSKLSVNGIDVTAKGKSVTDAIQGVTLNLSKIGNTTLTVGRDNSTITANVNALVKAYNDLDKTIKTLTGYDAEKKTAGALLGDSAVMAVQSQLRNMLGGRVPDASGGLSNLPAIGVTFTKEGTLTVDSAKLSKAVSEKPDDVAALFASNGASTDSLVSFVSAKSTTKTGAYTVRVEALATRGTAVAGAAPTSLTVNAGSNDQLNVTVDGTSTSITLDPGNYTANTLAAALQAKLNGTTELLKAGLSVGVAADAGGKLTITSNKYGKESEVKVGGSAADVLFPGGAVETKGTDVSGSINGALATGSGQFLSTTDGLKLKIDGGAAPADRGTVNFSRGFAELVSNLVDTFKGTGGLLTGRTEGLQETIKQLGKQRDTINDRLTQTEKRYRAQFTSLDAAIGSMKATSDYLSKQLASLSASSS